MSDKKMKSILIGNGLDIQLGGDDYLNKWVIVRMIAKAKMGEYDALFKDSKADEPTITGSEFVQLFYHMVEIADKACKGVYDELVEKYGDDNIKYALEDFKKCHTSCITSVEQIGMEDWLLVLRLLTIQLGEKCGEEKAETEQIYESDKQALVHMILDSLYCEGNIQKLSMSEQARSYFDNFDNIFTLNYDNILEKQTGRAVFHLHGDFSTKMSCEDPNNAIGYVRMKKGERVCVPPQFEHCLCNAILDYSGRSKRQRAINESNSFNITERVWAMAISDQDGFEASLSSISDPLRQVIKASIDKGLHIGCDYHFEDFKALSGELTIIGFSPQNDNHIFEFINDSKIEHVLFYGHFKGGCEAEIKNMKLPIDKPYIIKNIEILWDQINVPKCSNSATYKKIEKVSKRRPPDILRMLDIVNSFYGPDQVVTMTDVVDQIKTIPVTTERVLIEMLIRRLSNSKNHKRPDSIDELIEQLAEFGETIKIASISPQAFYFLYLVN